MQEDLDSEVLISFIKRHGINTYRGQTCIWPFNFNNEIYLVICPKLLQFLAYGLCNDIFSCRKWKYDYYRKLLLKIGARDLTNDEKIIAERFFAIAIDNKGHFDQRLLCIKAIDFVVYYKSHTIYKFVLNDFILDKRKRLIINNSDKIIEHIHLYKNYPILVWGKPTWKEIMPIELYKIIEMFEGSCYKYNRHVYGFQLIYIKTELLN